ERAGESHRSWKLIVHMDPQCSTVHRPYAFDPDTHALSVVSDNVLITVNQEYHGVYLKTFNLITGYNTDRQYVSMAAMDLIPPLALETLTENRVRLTFYAKDCEKGDVVKFSYMLRAGWDIDNTFSTVEKQDLQVSPNVKVLCVHKFGDDQYPSLVSSCNDRLFRVVLDPESPHVRLNTIDMYRAGFSDDRKLFAVTCKGSDFVVVDDKLSKFFRRQGPDLNAPITAHLAKKAVTMQIAHNRGQFYVAMNREELHVVNERTSRFVKIPLPQGRAMGAGLVFNANDDLILTDMKGRNPAPFRFPSRGIPSLQTISCLKVVSMSPEQTLFESRQVGSPDEFVRVLFMTKNDRVAYSTHLILPPSIGESLPAPDDSLPPRFSPLYSYGIDPDMM
ncbi:hypothetical protein PENTCL1PPCAC_5831, partial [Pristionchus entomophagus]